MMKGVAAALSLALLAPGAQAQSAKQKNELCGQQAAERFATKEGASAPGYTTAEYQNHHNSKLNKCFYFEITDGRTEKTIVRLIRLLDLNENKVIISCIKYEPDTRFVCLGQEGSENVWNGTEEEMRALIKPFMEE
jgi:opacity protein-like surface antigen